MLTVNFQMFKLILEKAEAKKEKEKAEDQEIKLPISTGSWKKQESSRKTSISALLTMPKPLTVYQNKLRTIMKEMVIPDHLTCLLIWNNRLALNRKWNTLRLYIITLLV